MSVLKLYLDEISLAMTIQRRRPMLYEHSANDGSYGDEFASHDTHVLNGVYLHSMYKVELYAPF